MNTESVIKNPLHDGVDEVVQLSRLEFAELVFKPWESSSEGFSGAEVSGVKASCCGILLRKGSDCSCEESSSSFGDDRSLEVICSPVALFFSEY